MSELVLFRKPNFQGVHHHIFDTDKDLSKTFEANLPSTIIIRSGKWNFYSMKNCEGDSINSEVYGPGMYNTEEEGFPEDILSVKLVEEAIPIENVNEVIIFEKAYFRGRHHHIFGIEKGDGDPNLGETGFDNITSSVIVISGIWGFFDNPDYEWTEFNRLGPGMYSNVSGFNIGNDTLTSVMLYKSTERLNLNQVILFRDLNIQGIHHHIYCNDPNLSESGMQNVTSSIVVINGNWKFFGAPNFEGAEYWEDQTLGPGIYHDVTDYNIRDNVITSVRIGVDPPLIIAEPKPA
ncbi:MAG: beta/gamma crystallin-related protein [Candidatus Thorarchaeota archaeon]